MHKWAKEIMECVKTKVNAKGLDNIQATDLEELKCWTEISKNIAEYDYYFHITQEMEKPENKYGMNYDERGRYYGGRRGYERRDNRDMDAMNDRRMYYDDNMDASERNVNTTSSVRGYSESRYERARRGFEEAKDKKPNEDNMSAIEKLFDTFEDDLKDLKHKMTGNEKTVARNKLSNMVSTMM